MPINATFSQHAGHKVRQMIWCVYILRCADDSLYTGITTDVVRRIDEHNNDNKKGARYTRSRRPVILAYQESCENRVHASRREYQLKKLSRTHKLRLLANHADDT